MKFYIPAIYGLAVTGAVAYYTTVAKPNKQRTLPTSSETEKTKAKTSVTNNTSLLSDVTNTPVAQELVKEQLSPTPSEVQKPTTPPSVVEPIEPKTDPVVLIKDEIQVKPQKKLITSISDTIQPDPNVTYGELANGMRYILMKNEKPKNSLSVRLHVGAGSLNEADDQRGVAHFLEHMVFNGTKNYPDASKLIPMMQRLGITFGAHANAYTSFNETVYMLDIPNIEADTIDLTFKVMQDFAGGALLETDEIEEERGVIISEKTSRDSVNSRVKKQLYRSLLPDSLLSYRFPIGTEEVIKNVKRDRFVDFYTRFYRPKNMCIVCVGDLPEEKMKQLIEDSFSHLTEPENPGPPPLVGKLPSDTGFKTAIFTDKELTSSNLSLMTVNPYTPSPDTAINRANKLPLVLANYMLNKRFSNLLLEKPKTPILNGYASRSVTFQQVEFGQIGATAKNNDWKAALPVMVREFKTAIDHGFTEQELNEVQANILTSYENRVKARTSRKSPTLASSLVANYYNKTVFSTPETDYQIIKEALSNITPEACHLALKAFWATPDIFLTLTTPEKSEDMEKSLSTLFKEEIAKETNAPKNEVTGDFAYTNFGKPGKIVKEEHIKDLDIHQLQLSNNIRINLKKTDHTANSISMIASINGGSLVLPSDSPGFSAFATSIRNGSGLAKHTPKELNTILSGKSVTVSFSIGGSTFNYSGSTSKDDLELQLQVLAASISDPGFRPEAETRFRAQLPTIYKSMKHSAAGGQNEMTKILNASDSRFYQPIQEAYENYSLEAAEQWIVSHTKKNYLELTIVGDFDFDTLKPLLLKTIGALPKRNAKPKDNSKAGILAKTQLPKEKLLTYQSKIPSALTISTWPYYFEKYDQKEVRRLSILSSILSDRLRIKLREELGQSYSPGASAGVNRFFRNNSYILAYCSTQPEHIKTVNKALKEIGKDFAEKGATEDELQRALTPVTASFEKSIKTNSYWLSSVMNYSQARPEQLEWSRNRVEDFSSITLEEINALAKELLLDSNISQFTIQPE